MKKKKVYLSGPISGLDREEYLARFAYAEKLLRADGYDVVNPCRLLPCRWPWVYRLIGYNLTLLYDLWHLKKCDYILMLPGWGQSLGAVIEDDVAVYNDIRLVKDWVKYVGDINDFIYYRKKQQNNGETEDD